MTDKLHCPFCEAELRIDNIGFYVCPTVHCALWECEGVPQKVIKSLISGKKALDVLKEIEQTLDECFSSDKSGFTVFWDVIARRVHSVITHSTIQEE